MDSAKLTSNARLISDTEFGTDFPAKTGSMNGKYGWDRRKNERIMREKEGKDKRIGKMRSRTKRKGSK